MARTGLRVLTFTTLYPNSVCPRHGIFVETRLRHIQRLADFDVHVVAPVPWFPSAARHFGKYASFARVPREEILNDIPVRHPRYLTIPGLGMYSAPFALAAGAASTIDALQRQGFSFDLIDAHYFYPDGVAAAILAKKYGKPLLITARGSDLNLLPTYRYPRRLIRWAANHADAIVTVSSALKDRLTDLGIDGSRIRVLRNGVDCDVFRPVDHPEARKVLGVDSRPVFAAVGNLVAEKGFDLAIDATAMIPGATLVIVGEGPDRRRLEERAARRDIAERVRFLPVRPQRELANVYSAADALVLASSREGWPNVLLEAMACGTPVVAIDVGGVSEIVRSPVAGVVVRERTAEALAAALKQVLDEPRDRAALRRYALQFDWEETARGHIALCREVVSRSSR